MDVLSEEPELQPEERPRKQRKTETDKNVNIEMPQNNSEAPSYFTRSKSKENPVKRKRMDVSCEEPELQPEARPIKRRRTETDKALYTEMSQNNSEAHSYFTRSKSKENHVKRKRKHVSCEEPELQPEERPRKRRRTETDKDVNREMPQNNSEAPCYFTRSKSKENPVTGNRMDVSCEEETPRERRRTETTRYHETDEDSRPSCSTTVSERRGNPLERKRMDDSPEESEVQQEERRRSETNEPTQPVRRINPLRRAKFLGRYTLLHVLESGRFGVVFAGIRKTDGKKVAIKSIFKCGYPRLITLPGDTCRLPAEVALLKLVCEPPRCPYIINLLEWHETDTSFILVMERPDPCVDLEVLQRHLVEPLSENMIKRIMHQVVQAAIHCRNRGVLHRDIKEGNIILDLRTYNVKLVDFGCGVLRRDTPYNEIAGTRIFFPPEWFSRNEYHADPATIWNLGMFLLKLISAPQHVIDHSISGGRHIINRNSDAVYHLISWCLDLNPRRRPSLEQILGHDWFLA